jgi:hypothetical protein
MSVGMENKERKHDEAVGMTFPASDPTAHARPTSTETARRPVDRQAPMITREQIDQARPGEARKKEEKSTLTSEPVDRPSNETVEVRQGTGPRATVSVLLISLLAATIIGVAIVGYFIWRGPVP